MPCRFIIASAVVWSLCGVICWAQEPAPMPVQDHPAAVDAPMEPAVGQPPQAISAADITSQSNEVDLQLQSIEANIQPSSTVPNLSVDYARLSPAIVQLNARLDRLQAARYTLRQLEEQRREWNLYSAQVDSGLQRADDRWKSLQQSREELREIQHRWELTRDVVLREDLPQELSQRIDQILAEVADLRAESRPRIDELAEIIERLTSTRQAINTALRRIAELNELVNEQLFIQDSPPLWRIHKAEWLRLDQSGRQRAAQWFETLWSFAREHWIQLSVQMLIFIALAVAGLRAQLASKSWPADQHELDKARFLLSRPFAIAMAFTILTGLALYDEPPVAVRDAFYLLLLLPMLRLVAGLSGKSTRIAFYGLLSLSAIYQIVPESSDNGSLLLRVTLLINVVAAIAVISLVFWWQCPRKGSRWSTSQVAAVAGSVIVWLLFVVAFVAEVFGWVNLSHFLAEAVLLTCQGALLSILFIQAAAGLVPAIVRRGPGRYLLSARRYPEVYERAIVGLLILVIGTQWFQATLQRFRLESLFWDRVNSILAGPLVWTELGLTVGNVLRAIVVLVGTFFIHRILGFLLREELFPRLHVRSSSTAIFATLLKYVIVTAGLGIAGTALGFTGTQLTVLFGALGVGIGFGLQNIVSNFTSGLILLLEQPIKIGDIVEISGIWGRVKSIGIRATIIEAFEGSDIVVPNSDLISKEVKNWTLSNSTLRVDFFIGTSYSSDPREVLRIMLDTANENKLIVSEPAPYAMMYGFGDSSLNFQLLCWTSIESRREVINQLHVSIYEALTNAGIEIPFPQRDVHIRTDINSMNQRP